MKIMIIGDNKTENIEVVRRSTEEEAHIYYLNSKQHVLANLHKICEAEDVPAIYRSWIKQAIKLIKEGEF